MEAHKHQKTISIKYRISAIFLVFLLLSSIIIGAFSFFNAKNLIERVVGNTALSIAQAEVKSIDADKFQRLQSTDDMQSDYYEELHTNLNDMIQKTGVKYLFTVRLTSDNKCIYVVDGTATDDKDFSPLGSESSISDCLNSCFQGHPGYGFVSDQWGDMIKAYVPIEDASGNVVGALGADFDASYMMNQLNNLRLSVIIIIAAITILLAVILVLYISKSIGKPIEKIVEVAKLLAAGDIDTKSVLTEKDYSLLQRKDEIGELSTTFNELIESTKGQVRSVKKVSDGDLTTDIAIRSENDLLGKSLSNLVKHLSQLMTSLAETANQVASGSEQLSNSGATLSEGATEQASSIEELTASIEEITSQINTNAQNADKASGRVSNANKQAELGTEQMTEMLKAMDEINASSNKINSVIKIIDDIAFQTNLLALNATVEAARAGQNGKGFAVVADEVKNLASKSADAAKETTQMIEASIKKVEAGMKIANDTSDALKYIVEEVNAATELVKSIAAASNEQAAGIEQINQGIMQVSQVVQSNAASAEESSAESEELASQAEQLKKIISFFKLKEKM